MSPCKKEKELNNLERLFLKKKKLGIHIFLNKQKHKYIHTQRHTHSSFSQSHHLPYWVKIRFVILNLGKIMDFSS